MKTIGCIIITQPQKMRTIDLSLVAYWLGNLGTSQQQWKKTIIWYSLSTSLPLSLHYRFTLDPFIHLSFLAIVPICPITILPLPFWPSCNYIALAQKYVLPNSILGGLCRRWWHFVIQLAPAWERPLSSHDFTLGSSCLLWFSGSGLKHNINWVAQLV